jgi:hypothetical protein
MRSRIGRNNILKLKVNFLPEIITLSKEVRNLKNLGFRVPITIVNKAHQANLLYPFAISLIESIRTYERTLEKVYTNVRVCMYGCVCVCKFNLNTINNFILSELIFVKNSRACKYFIVYLYIRCIINFITCFHF